MRDGPTAEDLLIMHELELIDEGVKALVGVDESLYEALGAGLETG